jgi:hypothetical protein
VHEKKKALEDLEVDGRTTLNKSYKKNRECGQNSSGSGQTQMAGSCEHDNEHSGSIEYWKFLE